MDIAHTGTLTAYTSKHDVYGNSYTAFRFTDHISGKTAFGKVSGGESNVRHFIYGWTTPNEYDRKIIYNHVVLPIREFNRLVKNWPYAGCTSDELHAFVRAAIAK